MQRSAKLVDDQAYITAHARLSQKPFEYHTAYPPSLPVAKYGEVCTPYAGGCRQGRVTAEVVDSFNSLYVGTATRPNARPNTELFGTAPYKARGEGILRAPDVHSQLTSSGFNPHCAKHLSEVDWDRYECINAPLVVEDERVTGPRGGASTRVGPAYYAC